MAEPRNGRIGGGVLADNLLRNGIDLRFYQSTDLTKAASPLLHIDVNNSKIGINVDGPSDALQIPTPFRSTNLKSTTTNIAPNVNIQNSEINNLSSSIELSSASGDIFATSIATDDLKFDFNTLSTTTPNTNIELRPGSTVGTLVRTLDNPNAAFFSDGDRFGNSVGISGNYAIVGARTEDDTFDYNSGKAYIFDVTTGNLLHTLDNPNAYDTNVSDYFGSSVAISGNYAIVGTPNEDDAGGTSSGKAYIFDVTTGNLLHTLDNPNDYGTSAGDNFGVSVAISGNYAIVGAWFEDGVAVGQTGKAYIFDVTTGNLLHTLDNPNDYGSETGDYFGYSVSISSNYAIVGAYGENSAAGTDSGKAYIFDVTTGNLLHTLDNPNAYDTSVLDRFGRSVAISGNYAIVGAYTEDDAGGVSSGKAYIFDVTTGNLLHTLDNPNAYSTSQTDFFGEYVAISGNYAVVSAYAEDDAGGLTSGKAYIFDVTTGALVRTLDNPNAYGTSNGDYFGISVAISDNYIIVGAPDETDDNGFVGGGSSGKAYIFTTVPVNGTVEINSNWNITGGLHATGDVVIAGNINFGDGNEDSLVFEADLDTGIFPDGSNSRALGSPTKNWGSVYSNLLNGERLVVDTVRVGDTSLALRQGNIFYVAINGDDTNVGDHQHGPFRTLKHALSVSDASGSGPVTIHVYPGVYEEEFPLTVPENVTISGEDLRNTIIKPTLATNNDDAFRLYQNTTIENITIKDFYYDSINDTGYAFSFASGATIADRSPYIRNVSVITQGSVTTGDDPRGFSQGDAGKGALIDGAILDSSTPQGSMLFHSATFITPGVDCITMTNGVRVEWLNSFTYFATKGLYATQGVLGLGSNGTTFGAEIRSIGSANVYGTYGAYADGSDTLMYLIGHNFAYIGADFNVSNDRTLTISANETIELNNGKIYHTSTDADGNFKVGDAFFVDFETGTTSIDANTVDFSGVGSIIVRNGLEVSYIDGERVDTGNIRFTGNEVTTIDGDLNLSPQTEILNLSSNPSLILSRNTNNNIVAVEGGIRYNTDTNLYDGYSTGNLSFGGTYSEDRETSIDAHDTDNKILIRANNVNTAEIETYGLRLNGLTNDNLYFDNNSLVSVNSNVDIELRRNGTGIVDIFDFTIQNSNLLNDTNNNFSLATTDRGFVKFNSTTGLVIPSGRTIDRPATPDIGDSRWNTDDEILETWNGDSWQRSAGEGEEVTDELLKEFVDIYTIVLG